MLEGDLRAGIALDSLIGFLGAHSNSRRELLDLVQRYPDLDTMAAYRSAVAARQVAMPFLSDPPPVPDSEVSSKTPPTMALPILRDYYSGAYVKVSNVVGGFDGEHIRVLYLLPSLRFVYVSFWSGYERAIMTGSWTQDWAQIELVFGSHTVMSDALPQLAQHQQGLLLHLWLSGSTPQLHPAPPDALGFDGPMVFVGKRTVIPLQGLSTDDLPRTWQEVQSYSRL
jgi:hypothetical protein